MKLLFDQNLSYKLCARDLFPNSAQVRLIGLDTASDRDIWNHAIENDFTIVTQDGDFADLSALLASPPKIIWLRCGNQPTQYIERIIRSHANDIASFAANNSTSCLEVL